VHINHSSGYLQNSGRNHFVHVSVIISAGHNVEESPSKWVVAVTPHSGLLWEMYADCPSHL